MLELQQKKLSLDLALEFKEDGNDVMAADGSEEESSSGGEEPPKTRAYGQEQENGMER